MSEVRFAVLGCGSIAEIAHFPSIAKTAGATLAAVCDVNEETVKKAKEKWGAAKAYTDYKEMFASSKLDAVIIATPNNVHRNQCLAATRAGVHMIVEKPLAITNTEVWDMVRACKEANVCPMEQIPQIRDVMWASSLKSRPRTMDSKKRGASTTDHSHFSMLSFLTFTVTLPCPSTRVT